jgi:hypothetical protein
MPAMGWPPQPGGRDPLLQPLRRPKQQLAVDAERRVDRARRIGVERQAAHAPDDLAQQNRIEIRVDHLRAGLCDGHGREHHPERCRAIRRFAERQRRSQSRGVRQQMAHRNATGAGTVERGDVVHHR